MGNLLMDPIKVRRYTILQWDKHINSLVHTLLIMDILIKLLIKSIFMIPSHKNINHAENSHLFNNIKDIITPS